MYIPPFEKRKPGKQPTNFLKYIQELLGDRNDMLSTVQIAQMACNRTAWRMKSCGDMMMMMMTMTMTMTMTVTVTVSVTVMVMS